MRLVALLLLLFTTSGNVLCLKFDGVWETLWIFLSFALVTQKMHENKQKPYCYSVSSGVGASSFEIWTANLAQSLTLGTLTNSQSFIFGNSNWKFCKVSHPVGTLTPHIQLGSFLIWDFFFLCFYFWVKKSKPVGYTRKMYSQTVKITKWAEFFIWCLLLIFKVVYQDHFSTTVTSLHLGFCSERAAAGLGPSGLKYMFIS